MCVALYYFLLHVAFPVGAQWRSAECLGAFINHGGLAFGFLEHLFCKFGIQARKYRISKMNDNKRICRRPRAVRNLVTNNAVR